MISSRLGKGLIYAGDTPLASTIIVEQTGPMQLTVRAGSFTTTGQALIRLYVPSTHDPLITASKAEKLSDGQRVRIWLQDTNGTPVDKAKTYVLLADQVINLTSDPIRAVAYDVDLINDGVTTDVLVKRKRIEAEQYGDPPAGWTTLHELLFEFILPPGTADLTPITIFALTIKPGFPPGTGPGDWVMQTGGT